MNTHLTDYEIQQLAESSNEPGKPLTMHLEDCPSCKAKYELYKTIFKEINLNHPVVLPVGFEDEVLAAIVKRQAQKDSLFYYLLYGTAIVCSLAVLIATVSNIGIKKMLLEFNAAYSGQIESAGVILLLGFIGFFYICLNGYNPKADKNYTFSDLTF